MFYLHNWKCSESLISKQTHFSVTSGVWATLLTLFPPSLTLPPSWGYHHLSACPMDILQGDISNSSHMPFVILIAVQERWRCSTFGYSSRRESNFNHLVVFTEDDFALLLLADKKLILFKRVNPDQNFKETELSWSFPKELLFLASWFKNTQSALFNVQCLSQLPKRCFTLWW